MHANLYRDHIYSRKEIVLIAALKIADKHKSYNDRLKKIIIENYDMETLFGSQVAHHSISLLGMAFNFISNTKGG